MIGQYWPLCSVLKSFSDPLLHCKSLHLFLSIIWWTIKHWFHFAFLHLNVKWWKQDSIAVSVFIKILVEFDKNCIRSKFKYQSDDETMYISLMFPWCMCPWCRYPCAYINDDVYMIHLSILNVSIRHVSMILVSTTLVSMMHVSMIQDPDIYDPRSLALMHSMRQQILSQTNKEIRGVGYHRIKI